MSDSFREHVKLSLSNSVIYEQLTKKCNDGSDNGGTDLLSLVDNAVEYCYSRSKMIIRHMGEFTLHDSEHFFRILRLMGILIPKDSLEKLSNPELALLILAAFFHDIGMAPAEQEVKSWLGIWEKLDPSDKELEEQSKYLRFKLGRTLQSEEINYLRSEGKFAQADLVERYLVTDYIRLTHAERTVEIIEKDWADKLLYKDINLSTELAQICKSHNEDGVKLLDLDHSLVVGSGSFICLPFIGVMLRLCDLLDFDGNRTPKVLFAHLGVSDPVSLIEWEKHRSVDAWTIAPQNTNITFNATCSHPAIEHSIREFCSLIDYELVSCSSILKNLHDSVRNPFPDYYQIPLPSHIDRSKIKAKKDIKGNPIYLYYDTKFTLNKEQIIDILMGTKLYGQPTVALRELIQNSIDACKLREKMEESWGNISYKPEITVSFSKVGGQTTLQIADNGVGMDQEIIDKFYSKVGASYYTSQEFLELKSSLKSTFIPTSRFGIGILSCFMISDGINIETKRIYEEHKSSEPITVSIVGQESIFYVKSGLRKAPGTTTTLILRNDNPWATLKDPQILDFILQTVPFPPFDMEVNVNGKYLTHKVQSAGGIKFDGWEPGWAADPRIKHIRVDFDGTHGITGACMVAILEKDALPVTHLEEISKSLTIEEKEYKFKTSWELEINRLHRASENIDPNTIGGDLKVVPNNSMFRESRSKIALHGIEVPMSMFAQWNENIYQHAKVNWPICIIVKINISGILDINLNSARSEILIDDKWKEFEQKFALLLCKGLKEQVSDSYWEEFKRSINAHTKRKYSEQFLTSLNMV